MHVIKSKSNKINNQIGDKPNRKEKERKRTKQEKNEKDEVKKQERTAWGVMGLKLQIYYYMKSK